MKKIEKKLIMYAMVFSVMASLVSNFVISGNVKFSIIFYALLFFVYGGIVSMESSRKKCGKTGKIRAIFHGIFNSAIITVTYFLIGNSAKLKESIDTLGQQSSGMVSPQVGKIMGNQKILKFGLFSIIIFIANIFITKYIYTKSIKHNCSLCPADIMANLKKYNDYLELKEDKDD
tara:strand:- start:2385 stop:2909 length:525 start_codon:yes stop_codon:yes gene_type:complete